MRLTPLRLPTAARLLALLFLTLVVAGGSVLPPASAVAVRAQGDPRYFADTGFRIDDDKVWDYFTKRGGKRTFGLPTSRTFQFMGAPTQFFQRHVLQVESGGVRTINLLDDGLLPYTTIGGSTFPAVDSSVTAAAPKAGSATYNADVAAFLEKYAPDTWEGQPVKFSETFSDTVTLADAFPDGGGSAGLLTLLNLEVWGLPTSKPARDPGNNNFVFLRFQRGIMHYDASCKCTQGLLLADALKAIITGNNLPEDLAVQAAESPLLGQYDAEIHNGPLKQGLPGGIELANAFRPSLDTAQAGPAPSLQAGPAVQSGGPAAKPSASGDPAPKPSASGDPAPKPAAAPSGPPAGDPKEYLAKVADAGKNSQEQEKEAKKGSDNNAVWASNRIERQRTNANYNSGPVTIASKIYIAQRHGNGQEDLRGREEAEREVPRSQGQGRREVRVQHGWRPGRWRRGTPGCLRVSPPAARSRAMMRT